jgi:uncharacterized protein YndB with AHSA1/START domain
MSGVLVIHNGRTIELDTTILATPAEIWSALTSAQLLTRWFSPIADGGDSLGSDLLLSWGHGIDWHTRVTALDENRHLQWSDPPKNDFANGDESISMAVDWFIEPITGGRCVVRLFHSGFGTDTGSNDQYIANTEGWTFFLFNLRHYLEHHLGTPRESINERRRAGITHPQLWTRLLGDDGLRATQSGTKGLRAGDRLVFTMSSGHSIPFLVGRVEPKILWGTVESLNNGLLMIELEPGSDEYHFGIYLSVYGLPRRDIDALRAWVAAVADGAIA